MCVCDSVRKNLIIYRIKKLFERFSCNFIPAKGKYMEFRHLVTYYQRLNVVCDGFETRQQIQINSSSIEDI